MAFAYVSSIKILSFHNSKYFKVPLLKKNSFSINFEVSFPQIGRKITDFGIPLRSSGQPSSSHFHNQIVGPSLGLHIESIGNTLYYITSHPKKSTKNQKRCMSGCPTNTSSPSFKYP
jgi:hypothetical protein